MTVLHRLYRYVGPAEIRHHSRGLPMGLAVTDLRELEVALSSLGGGGVTTCTYVVDQLGTLRLADRSSEHVACAGGGPVMAAGEITLAPDGEVLDVSNQSTGFCPEVSSWCALATTLDAAGLGLPDAWTAPFEFRKCKSCGARSLIKDDVYECVECGDALPMEWNFDSAICRRGFASVGAVRWRFDVIEEAASADQDRASIHVDEAGAVIMVADGAGGTSHGARAAASVVDLAPRVGEGPTDIGALLEQADTDIRAAGGQTTAIATRFLPEGMIVGASVGDSELWCRADGGWNELTEHQERKPLIGTGRASPVPFARRGVDKLIMGSDGLFSYISWGDIERLLSTADSEQAWKLVDSVRLPSGKLPDDICVVVAQLSIE